MYLYLGDGHLDQHLLLALAVRVYLFISIYEDVYLGLTRDVHAIVSINIPGRRSS